MRKLLKISFVILVALGMGAVYGYLLHRDHIFPYKNINKAYMRNLYKNKMNWSIGIYTGSTPFSLAEANVNPVLSPDDVSDVDAAFVADPFIIEKNGEYYMFFEVLNMETFTGDIGYAISTDGKKWDYRKIILDEVFHLSYPCVFEWEGSYYMIPESSEDLSVRLYKASSFPEEWKYAGTLLSGYPFTDPTIFSHNDRWWMFTSNTNSDVLNLYSSDSLSAGWVPHPMNPLIENNKHIARPAGRVINYENKLYRIAQDTYPFYGVQVFAIEITDLTPDTYSENVDSVFTIVKKSGKGWNAEGMHQVDLFKQGNTWNAVVDGINRR